MGLFYYYFKNKDEAFEKAIDKFFSKYRGELSSISKNDSRDPYFALTGFFEYMSDQAESFRREYAEKLHWTVRWAIRERALNVIEPYIQNIVDTLVCYGLAPKISVNAASKFLTYGVGSVILHESREKWLSQKDDLMSGAYLIMGLEAEAASLMFPRYAEISDLPALFEYYKKMETPLHESERSDYSYRISERIKGKEVLVIAAEKRIVGVSVFSLSKRSIDYLAVIPEYRRRGIASRLLTTVLGRFSVGDTASAAFKSDIASADDALRLYKKFGFLDHIGLTSYGNRCHCLTLKITDGKWKHLMQEKGELIMRKLIGNDRIFKIWLNSEDKVTYNLLYHIKNNTPLLLITDDRYFIAAQADKTTPLWIYFKASPDVASGEELTELVSGIMRKNKELHIVSQEEYIVNILDKIAGKLGIPYSIGTKMNAYSCETPNRQNASGALIEASPSQRTDILKLVTTMKLDSSGKQISDEEAEAFYRYAISSGNVFLWHDGRIRSMANIAYRTDGLARINTIVTDRDSRGKGYAGMLVSELSSRLLSEGFTPVIYADADYPPSNRTYRRIGFKKQGKLTEYCFTAAKKKEDTFF